MLHYRCTLIDSDTDKRLDLGVFAATDNERARDKAEARFRNLLRKMSTGKWSIDVEPTEDPLIAANRKARLKLKDTTIDMFPVEMKT